MTTPRDIFEKDSTKKERIARTERIQFISRSDYTDVVIALNNDYEAGVSYGYLFIEETPLVSLIIENYLFYSDKFMEIGSGVEIEEGFGDTDEVLKSTELLFSGRILIYTENTIPASEQNRLKEKAQNKNLSLIIRDGDYLAKRIEMEIPLAFISHDSRDKDGFVRELAKNLSLMHCPVWYDEYSLIPGQSLRASIEDGIKRCKKCVLILSHNFIDNHGWTLAEFDSVFTKEILEESNVIIPVWYGVTKREVYEYSPRMADRVAVSSDFGVEEVARKLYHAIKS